MNNLPDTTQLNGSLDLTSTNGFLSKSWCPNMAPNLNQNNCLMSEAQSTEKFLDKGQTLMEPMSNCSRSRLASFRGFKSYDESTLRGFKSCNESTLRQDIGESNQCFPIGHSERNLNNENVHFNNGTSQTNHGIEDNLNEIIQTPPENSNDYDKVLCELYKAV